MTKILIAVPTYENIAPETFKAIYDLDVPDNVECDFVFTRGYDCALARNNIAKYAIHNKYDKILTIDSDVIVPKETLIFFTKIDFPVILGYYPRKTEPNMTDVFKHGFGFPKENRYSIYEVESATFHLFSVGGGGFGCAFISVDIFDRLQYPYFKYVNYENGELLSEDLYFCDNVKKLGEPIYCDAHIKCKHIAKAIL